ncbi:ATP-binding protein [Streptomyces avermitilis]|uniref:ATP-binding protein n=1 Tax=Streptomyces avermitilis TaxID=33903 RepID=UPI0036A1766C
MAPPSLPQPLRRPGRPAREEQPVPQAGIFGLPAIPASVAVARGHVRELLAAWNTDAETCDNAVLVASELVTNAIMHTASGRIVCRLRTDGARVRIEVEDEHRGQTLPAQCRPEPDDQGGRGLLLVGALSSDWGVKNSAYGPGHIVWAELSPDGGDPASTGLPATTNTTRPVPHLAEGPSSHGPTAHA